MNIYLIYFMIAVIFFIIIHSYYLPKNKYCHLSNKNIQTETNNNSENKNSNNNNNSPVQEGFDGHTEEERRYIKISDLKDLETKTNEQILQLDERKNKINDFKDNDKKTFYRANSNIDSYKKVKKFIEDEKYNSRYHESLREYDRNTKINNLNKEFNELKKNIPNVSEQEGRIKNIKNPNANHYINVAQENKFNNINKKDNLNNPFTIFANQGCLNYNNDKNNFKVSDMCDLSNKKQQFKLNLIGTKDKYNKIVKDSGNEFLYSILNNDKSRNELDNPFYIINPIENIEDSKKCLTQLGEHLYVKPCNLHTNQRWIPDFQNRI